jgi:undecaprenyl-diphosphatase
MSLPASVGALVGDGATSLDESVLRWFVEHREPWFTTVMRVLTVLGGSAFLIPFVLVVGGWYWRRRGRVRPLVLLATAYGGAYLLTQVGKRLTARPRPPADLGLTGYGGYAFPSGHAAQAAAVYVMLAVVVAAGTPWGRKKAALWGGAAAVVITVGITRCYLAAHWLTDVLAGWALGGLWAGLGVPRIVRRFGGDDRPNRTAGGTSPPWIPPSTAP